MAWRRRIFRRKRKSDTGEAGPEQEERTEGRSRADTGELLDRLGYDMPERDPAPTVVVRRSSEGAGEELDDTTGRVRTAADEAVRAAEDRALDEILALERDVERAKSEAGELRERLEQAERRAAEAESLAAEAESRADEARARPPEPAAIDVESPGAAERLAAALSARDRELEEERRSRTAAIERADRRLAEIEAQARAAAEGIDAAEQRLADEAERLRADAEERVRRKGDEADRRADERIAQAEEAVAASERRATRETEERIRAEERARAEAQRLESEARSAAADWLRKRTKALRREGQREAETRLDAELEAARRQLAAARAELERRRGSGRSAAISDTHEWKAGGLQEPPESKRNDEREAEDQSKPGQ
jgi:chemosensory pili system protein ChpA (sensor histidine kinase/response regulator)